MRGVGGRTTGEVAQKRDAGVGCYGVAQTRPVRPRKEH